MSTKLYPVCLRPEQRQRLHDLCHNGHAPAKKILHARVLLLADKDHPLGRYPDTDIAAALGLHVNTVARIRKLFVQQGEEPALIRKQPLMPPVPAKVDGRLEAQLIAVCCSPAPEGRTRWTLDLLVGELVGKGFVTRICRETVRRALKKTNCSLGGRNAGASRRKTAPALSPKWKTCSTSTRPRTTTPSR
jgi:homeodomain-containing protein